MYPLKSLLYEATALGKVFYILKVSELGYWNSLQFVECSLFNVFECFKMMFLRMIFQCQEDKKSQGFKVQRIRKLRSLKNVSLYSKKFCLILHQKEALIWWLQKLHQILVLLSELFIIFWCNLPLIMVQLRENFCSQQISASFWCNVEKNFLECS